MDSLCSWSVAWEIALHWIKLRGSFRRKQTEAESEVPEARQLEEWVRRIEKSAGALCAAPAGLYYLTSDCAS